MTPLGAHNGKANLRNKPGLCKVWTFYSFANGIFVISKLVKYHYPMHWYQVKCERYPTTGTDTDCLVILGIVLLTSGRCSFSSKVPYVLVPFEETDMIQAKVTGPVEDLASIQLCAEMIIHCTSEVSPNASFLVPLKPLQ